MKGAIIARSPADLQAEANLPSQANDAHEEPWQQALQNVVTDLAELLALLGLSAVTLGIDTSQPFPLKVPRAFVARMQWGEPNDPLLKQVLPVIAERIALPGYSHDPLAEAESNPVPGLIHKYHGRVLLIVTGHCGIHCRYCFRRHFPYADNQPSRSDWSRAFDYIRGDVSISEVILSGGDPLSVPDRHLQWMIDEIATITHVRRLRIHSRLPVVIPSRVTPALVAMLATSRLQASLVIHANHAQELDNSVMQALMPLRFAGITLLNQAVLLAGVNDDADTLVALSERLFEIGVLPYYVHLLDRVAGATHFDAGDACVQPLRASLLARLPGYLVPQFVREVPQASSKIPFSPPGL